jgi:hypothetical protein
LIWKINYILYTYIKMEALLKAITKEKRGGFGAINYYIPKKLSKNERKSLIEYVKKNYIKVEVFGDAEDGRLAGYNHKGCYIGDVLYFGWE